MAGFQVITEGTKENGSLNAFFIKRRAPHPDSQNPTEGQEGLMAAGEAVRQPEEPTPSNGAPKPVPSSGIEETRPGHVEMPTDVVAGTIEVSKTVPTEMPLGQKAEQAEETSTLAITTVRLQAVGQLRESYADRFLHQLGHHSSRIGVDFVNSF